MPHQAHQADCELQYLLYLPPQYNPQDKYPAILFLHGSGERGNDLSLVELHGLPKRIEDGDEFPFIIISPQCPVDVRWTDEVSRLSQLLDHVENTYAIDKTRFYLTGMSMGGQGAWALAVEHPTRFAAVAPICGRQIPDLSKIYALKNTPMWVFHGAKDSRVPPENSELMVGKLKDCGGDVRLTIYPDADHDAWTQTYANSQLYNWFLEHRRV